jgi:hypothetical protein
MDICKVTDKLYRQTNLPELWVSCQGGSGLVTFSDSLPPFGVPMSLEPLFLLP